MKNPSQAFAENDAVIFYDRKERLYYDVLRPGRSTNIRGDLLPHDQIIGRREGFILRSQRDKPYWVFRPTLNDHVVHMRRGATVIYPKDLGVMLQYADIYPGATVVESGLGSGALATALLRMVGPQGRVISYEIRQDFITLAQRNLQLFAGETPNHVVRQCDIYEHFEEEQVDRLLLDVPEPWRVLPGATPKLRAGAIVCSYSPTIIQAKSFVEALRAEHCFIAIQTLEVMLRPWNIAGLSVRPALRMVGHTGFLTFARKSEKSTLPPEPPPEAETTAAGSPNEEEHEAQA
ncbi:MAG: tRNA (adenine-N1)-methyltransferase [candidate division KSB1 bacterium]|nr:tRNA (adenine-N1)-methyltransferase [candidate division KSB1 bacterium]MDZ7275435.1 tRNA (adenine-N1)-methyltransferase [candidate division KSB1 bacterium]MDZ7286252.1 tRNA (adenine-N1)-methyltransferase [candidate division KSB1 bacterium]MDZ7296478.1 tRNA (adenine-N1)-methyltransferase [candidate division KSB1 bacterium]MDZ7305563.1 tRNA (adenine-N1)-methyltransferase [candidate division KSB1 bacterium]